MKIAFIIDTIEFSIPLGIAYLVGILKKHNYDIDIFEIGPKPERAYSLLESFKPTIVAYSVISGKQNSYLEFNRILKSKIYFVSVFGGPHTTFFPEMIEEEFVDAICIGEGELAMDEFIKKFIQHNETPTDVLNFWVKVKGKIYKNPIRPLINEIDNIPLPSREIFYKKFSIINRYGIKHFLAHRGCPYRCTYCFNASFNDIYKSLSKTIYRSRDPYKICEEIKYEKELTNIQMVAFVDDVFTLDRDWIKLFSDVYKKEIRLPFSINARFDNLDEERISLLKEAGCTLVYLGVESGNDFIRNTIMKRNMKKETMFNTASLLKKYDIKFLTENIIGLPDEDLNMAFDTLKMNIDIKPNFSGCSFFSPYPKLELTDYVIKKKSFDGDFSKLGSTYFHNIFIGNRDKKELNKKLNLRCFFSFLSKHPYLFRIFQKVILPLPANKIFRVTGDLIDGYYLKKCLPYKIGITDTVKNMFYYLFRYRRTL